MTLNLMIPQQTHTDFTPRIAVIGVGGGGTNAVDNMIALELKGVEFIVANTDAQQLMQSRADRRIQLGPHITQGLGAGAKPEIGRAAAEEAADELVRHLDGTHMVFVTAGMGGGTGTGAAPVIARMARERNILTVGVVTKPFAFEGGRRARAAEQGIEELQHYVDTLIVIPNQNLFRMANEKTTWKEAFKMADNVLYMGVRGVTDLMIAPGLVNLDFADIRTVMAEMGKAMMGTGESDGDNRAVRAAEAAISNPLLEDTSMSGARGLLINITGGDDMTLFEVDQAANRIREEVDEEANIIFGSAIDQNMSGRIRVSVVATGIDKPNLDAQRPRLVAVGGGAPVPVQSPAGAPVHASGPLPVIANVVQGPVGAPVLAPVVVHTTGQQPIPLHLRPAEQPRAVEEARADAANPVLHAMPHASPPGSNTAPRPRASGLFAEPPAPAVVGSGAGSADVTRRHNIFREVTGRIRQSLTGPALAASTPDAPQRTEPQFTDRAPEPVRPVVRQSAAEDVALDIPAFLRRQSS